MLYLTVQYWQGARGGLCKRKPYVFDTPKRAKLCSECAHWTGYESANRHLWNRILANNSSGHLVYRRSQCSHYQWLRVISCTFECRLLLCSAKRLLIRRDVTATTVIHVHFFGVTFTVTASSQEQQREVRISATHVHWPARDICPEKSSCSVYQSYQFCPAWMFYSPSHDVDF